jgi:hypothetical protein
MLNTKLWLESTSQFISENLFEFVPSQERLSFPIIKRLYLKMRIGIQFAPLKICNGIIIDGHHRYVAACLAKISCEYVPAQSSSILIRGVWQSVKIVSEDWDTPQLIQEMNITDAKYSNINLDTLNQLIE